MSTLSETEPPCTATRAPESAEASAGTSRSCLVKTPVAL